MQKILKFLVALIGLFCAVIWAQWMLDLDGMAVQWALAPRDAVGTNNLRGDLGGLFLAGAVFCAMYFLRGGAWLRAAAVLMGSVALCRVIGIAVDGFSARALVSALVEVAFVAVFLAAAALPRNAPPRG